MAPPGQEKKIGKIVRKKLELYMNREKRENMFDPGGYLRTTHKMHTYDLCYQLLARAELEEKSPRFKKESKDGNSRNSNAKPENSKTNEKESSDSKYLISPRLKRTSSRMILYSEADRLTDYANKIYNQYPLERLELIHHFRPSSHRDNIPRSTLTGYVHNFNSHVGAILNSPTYIDYCKQEGLETGHHIQHRPVQLPPKFRCSRKENNKFTSYVPQKLPVFDGQGRSIRESRAKQLIKHQKCFIQKSQTRPLTAFT